MTKPKAKGRPSTFTQAIADDICKRLALGEPLAVICRDEHMPGVTTVWEWTKAKPALAEAIARAREIGFDVIAAECLEIADNTANDTKMVGPEGHQHEVADSEWISRSKLRVETRLKLLAKWDPKRYGDKVSVVGGDPEQGDKPVQHAITVRLV